ncbi:hypothetical protein, partial [Mesorhizobium sp. M2D.F.Ca.ET.206.01.1.1]|uniref:hypothetical protein n=1 Tax=Mesorhizobium sp. M2D.F.Ca.ET.206.01.1.1 TaxID=2563939 RepID=UPI001AEE2631
NATVSSSARPKGRAVSSADATSTLLRGAFALATGTDAIGALGRTTELVVSLDGFCMSSASMPDVDEQPARHSDAITKLMTPDNRIWTCTQTQQTEGDGRRTTRRVMNEKLPIKFESSFLP